MLPADGKRLTLLHFTDTHAQMETHLEYLPGEIPCFQPIGGFARLRTAIDRERAKAEGACILVDSGDEFQGSAAATWSEGQAIIEPLNALTEDEIFFELIDELSPGVIKINGPFLYVVMPMRLS